MPCKHLPFHLCQSSRVSHTEGVRQALVTAVPVGGYQMTISTRAGLRSDESDPVFTVSGVVVPRNS